MKKKKQSKFVEAYEALSPLILGIILVVLGVGLFAYGVHTYNYNSTYYEGACFEHKRQPVTYAQINNIQDDGSFYYTYIEFWDKEVDNNTRTLETFSERYEPAECMWFYRYTRQLVARKMLKLEERIDSIQKKK